MDMMTMSHVYILAVIVYTATSYIVALVFFRHPLLWKDLDTPCFTASLFLGSKKS